MLCFIFWGNPCSFTCSCLFVFVFVYSHVDFIRENCKTCNLCVYLCIWFCICLKLVFGFQSVGVVKQAKLCAWGRESFVFFHKEKLSYLTFQMNHTSLHLLMGSIISSDRSSYGDSVLLDKIQLLFEILSIVSCWMVY